MVQAPCCPDPLSNWVTSQWIPSIPIPKLWKKASDMLCAKLTEAQENHGAGSTTGLRASPEFNAETFHHDAPALNVCPGTHVTSGGRDGL